MPDLGDPPKLDRASGWRADGTREIAPGELELLATGAWILGAGGGGSPYHAFLNAREQAGRGVRVTLLDPRHLDDDDLVAVVSNMGAPLVGQERLSDPAFAVKPLRLMERYLGRSFRAVMSLEIGGGNALQPLLIAGETGLPVVDADCMGRAYPEAQMTTFAIGDLEMFPLTLADIRDNEVIVARAASWKWMERVSRAACTAVGSIAATCKAPRTGREVKEWGVLHTVTQAIRLGRAVHRARVLHGDPVAAAVQTGDGVRILVGKVTDVVRRATEGFLRGAVRIAGLGEDVGSELAIDFQNEWTVARRDGIPVVTVPDIIAVLDTESGEAVGTETIRYGQRVTVIALPAPPLQTTPKGLDHVGPRAFGHDLDFVSPFAGRSDWAQREGP
ncbi:MAG: DUF917 domain-containing protein [Gemmatimonadota bacterium]